MEGEQSATARRLLAGAVPAVLIGVGSALVLLLIDLASEGMHEVLWVLVPEALGIPSDGPLWIVAVLTTIGFLVGLVLQFAPGGGGPDSAVHDLTSPAPPLRSVPGIGIIAVLVLAGGVSLGPESTVIAMASALAVAGAARLGTGLAAGPATILAIAGTVGAMFGTPVAAALLLTGVLAALPGPGALWDRLFLPLASATAGTLTMWALGARTVAQGLPPYVDPQLIHLLLAPAVAVAAAALGVLGALGLRRLHRVLHRIPSPLLMATLGGLALGVLGAVGGPLTLFRGLTEVGALLRDPDAFAPGELLWLAVVKLAAIVIATSAGFRGGRVFPALFVGTALGLAVVGLIPDAPLGLVVGSAIVGIVLAVTRDGWLALLLAVVVVGDVTVLPLLCVAVLPTWLLVTATPPFLARESDADPEVPRPESDDAPAR